MVKTAPVNFEAEMLNIRPNNVAKIDANITITFS